MTNKERYAKLISGEHRIVINNGLARIEEPKGCGNYKVLVYSLLVNNLDEKRRESYEDDLAKEKKMGL